MKRQPLPELVRRMQAVAATQRHFAGRARQPGVVDCGQMAKYHLRQFGWKTPSVPAYRTVEQGEARLAGLGCATMAELIDAIGLPRTAPAAALQGDLVFLPGNRPSGALGIAQENGAMLVFHEDHAGLVTFRSSLVSAAWRVVKP